MIHGRYIKQTYVHNILFTIFFYKNITRKKVMEFIFPASSGTLFDAEVKYVTLGINSLLGNRCTSWCCLCFRHNYLFIFEKDATWTLNKVV